MPGNKEKGAGKQGERCRETGRKVPGKRERGARKVGLSAGESGRDGRGSEISAAAANNFSARCKVFERALKSI